MKEFQMMKKQMNKKDLDNINKDQMMKMIEK